MAVEESRPRQMQPNDCFPSSTVDPRTSGRKKCKGRNDLRNEKEKIERRILASTKVKKLAVIRKKENHVMGYRSSITHGAVSVAQGLATDLVLPSKIGQRHVHK